MARTISVAQMIADVRSRADCENDPHKTDAEIRRWLSAGYARLYAKLVSSGLAYYEKSQTITTAGSTGTYALPADYLATIKLDYQFTSDIVWPVREISIRELHRVRTTGAQRSYFYRVVQSNLIMYPNPPDGQTYIHKYIPVAVDITTDTDGTMTIDGFNGFEEYVVLYAAMQAINKEDRDVGPIMAQLRDLDRQLDNEVQNRNIASATSLIDDNDILPPWELDPANWRQY